VPAFGLREFPFYPRPYGSSTWHNFNYLSTQDIVFVINSQNASVEYVRTPSKRPAEALPVLLCEGSYATRTGFNEQSSGLSSSRLVISPAALPLATFSPTPTKPRPGLNPNFPAEISAASFSWSPCLVLHKFLCRCIELLERLPGGVVVSLPFDQVFHGNTAIFVAHFPPVQHMPQAVHPGVALVLLH